MFTKFWPIFRRTTNDTSVFFNGLWVGVPLPSRQSGGDTHDGCDSAMSGGSPLGINGRCVGGHSGG